MWFIGVHSGFMRSAREEDLLEFMVLSTIDLAWMALGMDEEVGLCGGRASTLQQPESVWRNCYYHMIAFMVLVDVLFSLCKGLRALELLWRKRKATLIELVEIQFCASWNP